MRSSHRKLWDESFGDGDIDYRQIAAYLSQGGLEPLLVGELAYRNETKVTRSLEENLRLGRQYTEQVFGVK